jgi:hypothetical protein
MFFPDAEVVHVGGASHGGRMYVENLRGHLRWFAKHRGAKDAERVRKLLLCRLPLPLRSRLIRHQIGHRVDVEVRHDVLDCRRGLIGPGLPGRRTIWPSIVSTTGKCSCQRSWGHQGGDNVWVWRSFLRGLNVLFMEELLPSPTWQDSARDAMGQSRRFSRKIDLARMVPVPELVQTGYVLADRGREYLAFQDGGQGEFWIELKDAPGTFAVEWLNVTTGKAVPGRPIEGGGRRLLTTPFPGPAVAHVKWSGSQ